MKFIRAKNIEVLKYVEWMFIAGEKSIHKNIQRRISW